MTQRHISHDTLPACRKGHVARHIHDQRSSSAGGGHLVECECSHTRKHESFDEALLQWKRMHRIRTPRPLSLKPSNVLQLGLRLGEGATRR